MSIERRIGPVPFQFMFADRRRYATAADYKPSTEYYDQVSALAPKDWEIARSGAWWSCFPPLTKLPYSGFKVHISASVSNAQMVLEIAANECVRSSLPFKFLVDKSLHNFANSKNYSEWSCGKFVTVYPANKAQFYEVAKNLSRAVPDAGGPYIFSDAPVLGSLAVFYRYGTLRSSTEVNIYGEVEQSFNVIGKTFLDQANPAFSLPPGVSNPFVHGSSRFVRASEAPLVLAERYEVTEIIHRSNSGAVFGAIDLTKNEEVVLKEARHGVTSSGVLVTEILRNEFEILEFLNDTKVPPSPIDYFQLAHNEFLVMEKIDGVPLTKYRASPVPTALHRFSATNDDEETAQLALESTLDNLLSALEKVHARGVVVGDLAPQNILIDEADLKVRIVDFEAARHFSSQQSVKTRTIGYGDANDPGFKSDLEAALSSVANVMLPLQAGAELNPQLVPKFLNRVSHDYPKLSALCQSLDARHVTVAREDRNFSDDQVHRELLAAIENAIGESSKGYLWACDYRGLITNPLSLAFGGLGIAPALNASANGVPQTVHDWISSTILSDGDYAPGLFVGRAGVAFGLFELARPDDARTWLLSAINDNRLFHALDVFYGATGVGLACLQGFSLTGEEEYLDYAISVAEGLEERRLDNSPISAEWALDYSGFCHGHAGIAMFFISLYYATRSWTYLEFAKQAFQSELDRAYSNDERSITWQSGYSDSRLMPYFRIGSAGIGAVACRLFEATKDLQYIDIARKIAAGSDIRYCVHHGLFTGMAGIAEFYLDLQQICGLKEYDSRLLSMKSFMRDFMFEANGGLCLPSESLTRVSFDYGTGAAGVSYLFERLSTPTKGRRLLDLHF